MPNDAKMGIVLGVGVVITISAVFYHQDAMPGLSAQTEASAAALPSGKPAPADPAPSSNQPLKGKATSLEKLPVDAIMPAVEDDATGLNPQ